MKWIVNILTWQLQISLITTLSLLVTKCTRCVYRQFAPEYLLRQKNRRKCLSFCVRYRRLLTDVCWFEATLNVPVKSAALCLIVGGHASVIGRREAHRACVCSGKLLNCFCVYTKDHATENIVLSSQLCAQRIWSSTGGGEERRHDSNGGKKKKKNRPQTAEPICLRHCFHCKNEIRTKCFV